MSRHAPLIAIVLALLAGLGVLGIDRIAPPAEPSSPSVTAARPAPVSGAWVCPVGDRRPGTSLSITTARPDAASGRPAAVELQGLEEGQLRTTSVPELFPASDTRVAPGGGAAMAVAVRWSGAPVAPWREWVLEGGDGEPAGTVAGGCVQPFAERWIVPGMSTLGGEDARLRLANPFDSDATVAVGFVTPEGAEAPLALRNLTVPAHGTLEIEVGEHLPERADLAAIVEVATGRVAVEGYQLARSAIGGIDGASLLAAATEPAEAWTVPWIADGDDTAAWLWVANTGERTASVGLTLHTPAGGEVPIGLTEVTVPPGTVRRVDLRGTLPAGATSAAVTARSDGAPVVVSAAVAVSGEAPGGTGFSVQLGVPEPDRAWVVGGGATSGRAEELHLVNPGSEPAVVDVSLFNGTISLRPVDLQGLELPPGVSRRLALDEHLGEVRGWTAFVTARSGSVVVGRHGRGGDPALHLVAAPGVSSGDWGSPVTPLAGAPDPGLVRRLRTSLGVSPIDPLAELEEGAPLEPTHGPDDDPTR